MLTIGKADYVFEVITRRGKKIFCVLKGGVFSLTTKRSLKYTDSFGITNPESHYLLSHLLVVIRKDVAGYVYLSEGQQRDNVHTNIYCKTIPRYALEDIRIATGLTKAEVTVWNEKIFGLPETIFPFLGSGSIEATKLEPGDRVYVRET